MTGPEARHIALVLRLAPGQEVEFFDGSGAVFSAVLEQTDKDLVRAAITRVRRNDSETKTPLILMQALLKGKKMDLLVQKATELGVHTFVPVLTRYCENHGNREHQHERWQRIMIEACKQCQRLSPMRILPVTALSQAKLMDGSLRVAAWEDEQEAALPATLPQTERPVYLFLGPEGGLHGEDLSLLHERHFSTFSLGPRILRGETAAIAAISIIQYLRGALQPAPLQHKEPCAR